MHEVSSSPNHPQTASRQGGWAELQRGLKAPMPSLRRGMLVAARPNEPCRNEAGSVLRLCDGSLGVGD